MDHLGRKLSFVLVSVPRLVCCLLMVFASEVWMLILGRSLNGISDIFGIGLMFTYTSEIASVSKMTFYGSAILIYLLSLNIRFYTLNFLLELLVLGIP